MDLVDFSKTGGGRAGTNQPQATAEDLSSSSSDDEGEMDEEESQDDDEEPHWLIYPHLDGYFNGLKAVVPVANYTPEYPRKAQEQPPSPPAVPYAGLPTPKSYAPQPDYNSSAYTTQYHTVKTCYLDEAGKVPAPDVYAYDGVVQGQAEAAMGSYTVLGLRDDVCFDRFGRYGPYGLGYGLDDGGVGAGQDTEKAGSEAVWAATGKIDYARVDWGQAQDRCYAANKHRFVEYDEAGKAKAPTELQDSYRQEKEKLERIAVVIRSYVGFRWTQHAILNFRAMVSELALRSGGEYQVHFLLHVRDDETPIWADAETVQRLLDDNVPAEFHSMCTLWSESQMWLVYPGDFGSAVENPSNGNVRGVYRSAHLALQHFALTHPQYAHFWNWEMDMRWIGSYYELFDRLGAWARNQSREQLWERSSKYYIPAYHGSWDKFTALVRNETEAAGRRPIMGPVTFPGRQMIRSEERGHGFVPVSCARGSDMSLCGVGEEADLVTLNPLFDTEESGWVFAQDVTGYDHSFAPPPRRGAIVTASRLSRRLLQVMHEETWRLHHSMFSEMFPASMALHHGLKAVYAPHPVYLDRAWDLEAIDGAFNGGRDHTSGGQGSSFAMRNEHNHRGTSWYYNSEFAGLLWRRWLGYAQMDGRGTDGGHAEEGTLRGGRDEEEKATSTGRLCLRSMLVHPIKWELPSEKP